MRTDPQSFDHLPARYDRIATLLGAELRAWLLFHLPPRGGRAVDLGCGTGVHTELLAERYDEVLGVDLSAPMVTFAGRRRHRANVSYLHQDLLSVEGRFDLVFSAYTLHHVPELDTALHRMRSLVRPGGLVLLVDLVDDRLDEPGTVPRSWFRAEALRTFRDDLWRRRRGIREAVELLRLQLDGDWLDHQSTDRLRSTGEWDFHCRAVFPGASISPLARARGLAWTAPATGP